MNHRCPFQAKELRYQRINNHNQPPQLAQNVKRIVGDDQMSKVTKLEEDVPTSRARSTKNAKDLLDKKPKDSDLESKMEAHTKELWALKDELKKHVTTAELHEMLQANGQDAAGSELDLCYCW